MEPCCDALPPVRNNPMCKLCDRWEPSSERNVARAYHREKDCPQMWPRLHAAIRTPSSLRGEPPRSPYDTVCVSGSKAGGVLPRAAIRYSVSQVRRAMSYDLVATAGHRRPPPPCRGHLANRAVKVGKQHTMHDVCLNRRWDASHAREHVKPILSKICCAAHREPMWIRMPTREAIWKFEKAPQRDHPSSRRPNSEGSR